MLQVIYKLKNGIVHRRKVTIPEGLTSLEIINILKNTDGIIQNNSLSIPEEGTLFPSTYFYIYGTEIENITARMNKKMEDVLQNIWKDRGKNMEIKNYNELLILASIIEKETSLNIEKPIIAQVFLKRLNLS